MGSDETGKVGLSVGEAKARLLEYGHRPRGPKAAIRRDPVAAAALAFFVGVVISRFRPGPLLPLGALLSRPLLHRVLPIIGRLAVTRLSGHLQKKAGAKAHAQANGKHRSGPAAPRPYQNEPFTPSRGEWAMGPQRPGVSPPRARSQPPPERRS